MPILMEATITSRDVADAYEPLRKLCSAGKLFWFLIWAFTFYIYFSDSGSTFWQADSRWWTEVESTGWSALVMKCLSMTEQVVTRINQDKQSVIFRGEYSIFSINFNRFSKRFVFRIRKRGYRLRRFVVGAVMLGSIFPNGTWISSSATKRMGRVIASIRLATFRPGFGFAKWRRNGKSYFTFSFFQKRFLKNIYFFAGTRIPSLLGLRVAVTPAISVLLRIFGPVFDRALGFGLDRINSDVPVQQSPRSGQFQRTEYAFGLVVGFVFYASVSKFVREPIIFIRTRTGAVGGERNAGSFGQQATFEVIFGGRSGSIPTPRQPGMGPTKNGISTIEEQSGIERRDFITELVDSSLSILGRLLFEMVSAGANATRWSDPSRFANFRCHGRY